MSLPLRPEGAQTFAAKLGRLLLAPGPRIAEPSRRATAILFAGALLALLGVFGAYDVFLYNTQPHYQPPWPGYAAILTSYILLRAGHYLAAVAIILCTFPVVAFVIVVSGASTSPFTLNLAVLSVLLATLLVGARGTAMIAALSTTLVVMTVVTHTFSTVQIAGPLVLNALGGVIAVLSVTHRNALERDRRVALQSIASELERRVEHRTAELQRANSELEAFSYSVSHDLRAPVRAVDGFSAILLEDHGERLGEEGREVVRVIQKSAARMSELIDGLLLLSRVTRAPVARSAVDLVPMFQEAIAPLRKLHPERKVAVECPARLVVEGDPQLVQVLLGNLVANAWKFTAHVTEARITLELAERDGQRFACVRDNGAGFDMRHVDRLFRPFERLHREDEFPGTGIGLATVSRIVARHGGRAFAEGGLGKGAAFFFSLGSVA